MKSNQLNSLTDFDVITQNYLKAQLHSDICLWAMCIWH